MSVNVGGKLNGLSTTRVGCSTLSTSKTSCTTVAGRSR